MWHLACGITIAYIVLKLLIVQKLIIIIIIPFIIVLQFLIQHYHHYYHYHHLVAVRSYWFITVGVLVGIYVSTCNIPVALFL